MACSMARFTFFTVATAYRLMLLTASDRPILAPSLEFRGYHKRFFHTNLVTQLTERVLYVTSFIFNGEKRLSCFHPLFLYCLRIPLLPSLRSYNSK